MTNRTLNAALQQIAATTPIEAHNLLQAFIKEQQNLGLANGLPVGGKAKDFELKDTFGRGISLYEELSKGPVVLTFYRGGWCPYCNRQLRAYQEVLPDIQALGSQLIAVSPQLPDSTLSFKEKAELTFQVLSDPKGLVSAGYRLLYDVPESLKQLFMEMNIDLKEYNGTEHWILPVPATFMIDEHAVIRSAFVTPDFMKRMEPDEIIRELRSL
ncbi:alkyl hydroperoxide reductase [Paenibacillus sp. FSL H8-0548]|uniref:peroxiredoxin-like family protein n=1 Tax=Paenibacillus sp. FSL H8-0548 TaxID=1920422 RepID=UPI00096DDE69|nr:peroxiredoxin-like family protein [Paenibacillus sp. FSL H8-0548]OMF30104.1 alkyl hydroperoxide reductase [Paenibacillus sp. FSL H8-0548]